MQKILDGKLQPTSRYCTVKKSRLIDSLIMAGSHNGIGAVC